LSKPDRPVGPVEPGTGPASGPVVLQKRSAREPDKTAKTGKKPVTRPVQAVHGLCFKKKKLNDYVFSIWWFFINFFFYKESMLF
jgi:hypothetical protein